MHLILCHTTVDFDALGAAVGLSRIYSGSRIVLAGGCHPPVRDFLALHRDEFPMIERRSVNPEQIHRLTIVDTQARDRLGKTAEWLDLPQISQIEIWDHHPSSQSNIPASQTYIEPIGATTTLVAEKLQEFNHLNPATQLSLTAAEAIVMALGIHVDTGSLIFDHTTVRDVLALAWLMQQGANPSVISEYLEPGLSPQLQELLMTGFNQLNKQVIRGFTIGWILLETEQYVPGLSHMVSELLDLTESDAIFVGNTYKIKGQRGDRLTVIGRSRIKKTNLNQILKPWGGGGHEKAASVVLKEVNPVKILLQFVEELIAQIPHPPTAKELMSSPVRTIRPQTTIEATHRILLRYGHSGLSVVNQQDQLVGIISRRDIDIALHHGFSHAPVKGYMTPQLKTISPETTLPEIEALMVTYDIGRLPVLEQGNLVGIVTRTDVLRWLHQQQTAQILGGFKGCIPGATCNSVQELFQNHLVTPLLKLMDRLTQLAQEKGWQLYLVGGGVRDLLLASAEENLLLTDLDLVVDSYCEASNSVQVHPFQTPETAINTDNQIQEKLNAEAKISHEISPSVALAKALQRDYPEARLEVHGQFQTVALLWHNDPIFQSLWIDIATARTEFYPYPAANPEVEASSIRQDLYRRDFTINALALRLTSPNTGELLDFFGGVTDLKNRQIRVLHANSFIEDPTRIYRAVRFAVRLGFELEAQTKNYIHYAIDSRIYEQVKVRKYLNDSSTKAQRAPALGTRLKSELRYILQAPYWKLALQLLGDLKALQCIHVTLELTHKLWQQIRLIDCYLQQFDSEKTLAHWQIRLEGLIVYLLPEYRREVAENLQLPLDATKRLDTFEAAKIAVLESLPHCKLPSEIAQCLESYDLPTLILIAAQGSTKTRHQIRQYLTHWWRIKPPLNGDDLKQMGYQPGRQFKQMLEDLLKATLDGVVDDRTSAVTYIQKHYPL